MKVGVILPTFRDTPDEAVETARRAEALGIDGVFCYDHLWPLGHPDRPALAPFAVLGLLAATTRRLALGTLVARVGLVPASTLVAQFATLDAVAPGRVVAGLGIGDRASAAENRAYGIEFAPVAARLAEMRWCATALRDRGIPVWLGGRGAVTRDLAATLEVAANLWDAPVAEVAAQAPRSEVTWAGPVPAGDEAGDAATTSLLAALQRARAAWAVFGYPAPLELLASVGRAAGDR